MQPTLVDQERHLLVKVIDRVLYKLDELVRPYVHKILVVIEPLLIDEDYYARVEVGGWDLGVCVMRWVGKDMRVYAVRWVTEI